MNPKLLKKYQANSSKKKKGQSFSELAKKHIIKNSGAKKDIAINIDKILYGRS